MVKPSRKIDASRSYLSTAHLRYLSIRSSFENQTAISLKQFTAKNIYNFLAKRNRRLITFGVDGCIWKLVCTDPHRWCLERADENSAWGLARIFEFLSNITGKAIP
jgi:hypothetical protein